MDLLDDLVKSLEVLRDQVESKLSEKRILEQVHQNLLAEADEGLT